ncbi:hypothetical protein EMWEY_00058550 [Eimeria maxima]|uniref:Uncharacterized protein n=1 Tax=Eimeria maxima TaxID=5804 RepID=U6MB29_EIMMA|nr:hypothetical protein EMWEY_00058550 [Eimeria maxima]CDJ59674.1 hypothetical protein EMWEY_00058550 [Eimeria maxima]
MVRLGVFVWGRMENNTMRLEGCGAYALQLALIVGGVYGACVDTGVFGGSVLTALVEKVSMCLLVDEVELCGLVLVFVVVEREEAACTA